MLQARRWAIEAGEEVDLGATGGEEEDEEGDGDEE